MKVTSSGRVTIPKQIREQAGSYPGCEVDFNIDGNNLNVVVVDKPRQYRPDFADWIRGNGTVKMTTDEIMALSRGEE